MNSPTTRIGIAAGIAAVVLAAAWYIALFRPESHHLKAAHAAHAAAEAQVKTLDAQVTQLKALEKQIPQDRARLQVLKAAVPDTPDLPDALGQLHNAATQSGVTLSSVSPTPPPIVAPASAQSAAGGQPPAVGPQAISLTLSATGTYAQMMAFMRQLDTIARTVVINTVSLSSGTVGALTANFTTQIFYAAPPPTSATGAQP
jgi:type IV pilus assembly protein PilO